MLLLSPVRYARVRQMPLSPMLSRLSRVLSRVIVFVRVLPIIGMRMVRLTSVG